MSKSVKLSTICFADVIRLNPQEYLAVQYITSNGAIFNEVINERGIPTVSGSTQVPRSEPRIIQSAAFQNALQAVSSDNFYISNFELTVDELGEPISPLQVTFSVFVPVFDLTNPRTALGTVRFVITADSILNIINNPILNESSAGTGRQFFLVDENNEVVANSNAPSQEYLFHLVEQEHNHEGRISRSSKRLPDYCRYG